jgi:hypothetical protein
MLHGSNQPACAFKWESGAHAFASAGDLRHNVIPIGESPIALWYRYHYIESIAQLPGFHNDVDSRVCLASRYAIAALTIALGSAGNSSRDADLAKLILHVTNSSAEKPTRRKTRKR